MASWSARARAPLLAFLASPVLLALLFAAPAAAQSATALDRLTLAPAGDALFSLPSADVTGGAKPAAGVALSYAYQPLSLRSPSESATLDWIRHQLVLHALASVELAERVKLDLDMPFTLTQGGVSGSLGAVSVTAPSGAAIADLHAGARMTLLHQEGFRPAAALGLSAWFPSGDDQAFSGAGRVRYAPAVIAGATFTDWLWTATVGGRFQKTSTASLTGSEVFAGAGAGLRSGPLQIGAELTLWGAAAAASSLPLDVRSRIGGELLLTSRCALGPFTLGAGAGPGMGQLPGTPRLRVFAALGMATDFAPPRPAALPPSPRANTAAGDGKPGAVAPEAPAAPDLDGDLVPDAEDQCPTIVGEAQPPAKPADGASPSAHPGFRRGCPLDRDEDSVLDADDHCPEVSGVPSAVPQKNGCPPDTDGDGIIDTDDACPNERGKPSNVRTTNGCPTAVRVEGAQIVILQQVQFATGRAEIEKNSFELLSEVAAVLQEHPEIARVAVDGHTDNAGPAKGNLILSQQRAVAVVAWLTAHGIDARRVEARGFGPRRPIADNRTEAGRAQNRRVEFQIRKRSDQGALGWKEGPLD